MYCNGCCISVKTRKLLRGILLLFPWALRTPPLIPCQSPLKLSACAIMKAAKRGGGRVGGRLLSVYLDRGSGNGCGRANMLFIIICSCCYFSCLLLLLISLFLIASVLRPSVRSRCCSHSRWCFGVVSAIVVIFIALHYCCSAVFGCFCSCCCRLCVFNKYIILWT